LISLITVWGCTKDDSNPSGPGGGGTTTDTTEILYDDGSPIAFYNCNAANCGPAVDFTLPTTADSYQVIGVKIRLGNTNAGIISFSLRIYEWISTIPAQPGNLISQTTITSGTQNTWNTWDISAQNVDLAGGEHFVAAMIYDGTNDPTYGYDSLENDRSWFYNNISWQEMDETYFIRAIVVNKTTSDIIELIPNQRSY